MKKRFVIGFALMLILFIISLFIDKQISEIITNNHNIILDFLFIGFTFVSNAIIIFFILTSLFLWKENKRRWIFPLWISGLFSLIISFLLKIFFVRPRPFQEGIIITPVTMIELFKTAEVWNFAFPSFQAMLVFSALPILNKEFKKFSYIWLGFAIIASVSRIYFGVHYASDVIFGALIGLLIGYLIVYLENKYGFSKKLIKKMGI